MMVAFFLLNIKHVGVGLSMGLMCLFFIGLIRGSLLLLVIIIIASMS
jgi:hypothetical protein